MTEAFRKYKKANPQMGDYFLGQNWMTADSKTIYNKVLLAYTPQGFSITAAIGAVKLALEDEVLDGVSLYKNTLKITNYEGPREVFNSIMGLAASHKKRTVGNTLEIDLFEKI